MKTQYMTPPIGVHIGGETDTLTVDRLLADKACFCPRTRTAALPPSGNVDSYVCGREV